jgi:hypothetical protein
MHSQAEDDDIETAQIVDEESAETIDTPTDNNPENN